ncbi:MAG TPA: RNA polymerase sigma factor [Thermoanaerobaculia bacterium]|jgi:RNA polymerase sigma factor (sigma-70 family)
MPTDRRALYEDYYPRVVGYLVKKFEFTVDEARDLAQDVFVSVFRHMEQKPIAAPWLFLKTAAHHRAVNEIRSRSIHRKTESGSSDAIPHLAEMLLHDFWNGETPPSPENLATLSEQAARLHDEIEQLPASLRPSLRLWLEGASYEEIGTALRLTVDAVRTRLRDARKLLVNRMRPGGG